MSNQGYKAIFDASSWSVEPYSEGVEGLKGTYTYKGNTATVVYTEITNDGVVWRTEFDKGNYRKTATVSGNKLMWGNTIYTKQ